MRKKIVRGTAEAFGVALMIFGLIVSMCETESLDRQIVISCSGLVLLIIGGIITGIVTGMIFKRGGEKDMMFYSSNPVADFERYDAQQEAELDKLPVCVCCEQPIQEEYGFCIDGDWYCEECLNAEFRKEIVA